MELIIKEAPVSIPQLVENFDALKAELLPRLEYYKSLIVTEDSIKKAKEDKATLNKLKSAIDERRKEIKKQIASIGEPIEKQCKELVALIEEPVALIDSQVKYFEDKTKQEKYDSLAEYFSTINAPEYVTLDRIINPKWGNKGETLDKLKKEVSESVSKINADYEELKSLYGERQFWFTLERNFKERLDKSPVLVLAVQLDNDEKMRIREEELRREREEAAIPPENVTQAHEEAQAVNLPSEAETPNSVAVSEPESIPMLKGCFEVECTREQLIGLVNYMKSNGINYKSVK